MKEKILNLTQHCATPEQSADGVMEPTPQDKNIIKGYLTFPFIPCQQEILESAQGLAQLAQEYAKYHDIKKALIGGAPYLMSALEKELRKVGIQPVYSFSVRQSKEITNEDGTVEKVSVFKHGGFFNAVE